MGSSCSTTLARNQAPHFGKQLPCDPGPFECAEEACPFCDDERDTGGLMQGQEHPLLQTLLARDEPPTPRGPKPPWASKSNSRGAVDRTATGATPPRSPTPPRMTPPGLPDEEVDQNTSHLSLLSVVEPKFIKDMFMATRSGDATQLNELLHRLNGMAMSQVCKETSSDTSPNERYDRASELVGAFLCRVREPHVLNPGALQTETLLGVACAAAQLEAVRLLLLAKVDPQPPNEDGVTALHRAAEGGSLLCVLMVLDRLQANCRSIAIADLVSSDGSTPETCACVLGASDIVRAIQVYGLLQADAENRQLGSSHVSGVVEGGLRGGVGTGDILSYIDLQAEVKSTAGCSATSLLKRAIGGSRLARNLFSKIPEDQGELQSLVDQSCQGLKVAEDILLKTKWDPSDPSVDPAVRGFVTTAELRAEWQKLRADAVRIESSHAPHILDDYWQTHLTADAMTTTIRGAVGDTFQLLLTVLWLYTREAWLRHILDGLAAALHAVGGLASSGSGDGATGATPSWHPDLHSAMQPLAPMLDALAPFCELVQSALAWFEEEQGIRHSLPTYRPLQLPMLGLQRLIDKYVGFRRKNEEAQRAGKHEEEDDDQSLLNAAWLSLGAGSFFSTMSSRPEAISRLIRTRSNTLLLIRPDEEGPCYPKHMMLRGSNVDDTLFPLDALFRVTRITRTVSSDLDGDRVNRAGGNAASSRWPVIVIEVAACSKFLEVLEHLELRGALASGELERRIEEWISLAGNGEDEFERLLSGAETIAKLSRNQKAHGLDMKLRVTQFAAKHHLTMAPRLEKAVELLNRAVSVAEGAADAVGVSRALQLRASCGAPGSEQAARKSIRLLEESLGANHPETINAKLGWSKLAISV